MFIVTITLTLTSLSPSPSPSPSPYFETEKFSSYSCLFLFFHCQISLILKSSYLNLAIFRFPYITAILRDITQEFAFKFNIY